MPEDQQTGQDEVQGGESHDEAAPTRTDWKAEARKWEQRAKDNASKLKDAQPKLTEFEQLKAANQTELERATGEVTRWQTEAETWRDLAVGNRIEALAAAEFADPTDAVSALAGTDYLVDGQIDETRIRTDLAAVLDRKPHYRRSTEAAVPLVPRAPAPNPSQGSGGGRAVADPAAELGAIIQGHVNRS